MKVLVLYDSHGPQMEALASAIADGVASVDGAQPVQRHLNNATRDDLLSADALVLGSPNWSGITGYLKVWLDEQGDLWEEGVLGGKVGAAFTIGRGRNTGIEFTLLGLIHWMLACGMIIVGLPWTDAMRTSGSYYGATAAGAATPEDLAQARRLGVRVAETALKLSQGDAGT